MELIEERDGREYWLQILDDIAEFRPPFSGKPYPVLIWETRLARTDRERQQLTTALIASEVRYGVCGGVECERWHDALDWAFLDQNLEGEAYDARFVMTSWHSEEPPDEVVFFFVNTTNFDAHDFDRFLIVQLGRDWAATEALKTAIADHTALEPDAESDEDWRSDAV